MPAVHARGAAPERAVLLRGNREAELPCRETLPRGVGALVACPDASEHLVATAGLPSSQRALERVLAQALGAVLCGADVRNGGNFGVYL